MSHDNRRIVHLGPASSYRGATAMGDPQVPPTARAPETRPATEDDFRNYEQVPAWYTASVLLGGNANDQAAASAALRPERYVVRRITWATTADAPIGGGLGFGSVHGRAVEITWGDEFTNFLGQQPALLSALFGDSDGFLDLPGRGLLFQGRQSLNAKLRRLVWPSSPELAAPFRFDIVFHGIGLLPKGVGGASGTP